MKYLYLDNFRGFFDAVIPIADVTFFVGENSTGKTSVLRMLELLSSFHFWFTQSFETEAVKFGHFKDIVSVHSEDRSYFTIGMIEDIKKKGNEHTSHGFLMTFKEKSGLPSLSQYTFSNGNKVHSIKIASKRILVKESSLDSGINADSFISTVLNAWKQEHIKPSAGYSNIPIPGK